MKILNETELSHISGGIGVWAVVGIAALVVLIAGMVDGFVNPQPCNIWQD